MIAAMFTQITQVVTAFIGSIGSALTGITPLFYDATDGFTLLGSLSLVAVGCGVVYFVWKLIAGLIRQRRA